jgi:WG containing repeat
MRFSGFLAIVVLSLGAFRGHAQPRKVLIGVRFGPGHAPCAAADADCTSPQREALLKGGSGPVWGFVDLQGRIVHSGYRIVLSFPGTLGWGLTERFRLNKDAHCKDYKTGKFHTCAKWEPSVMGWTLLDLQGSVVRRPYVISRNRDEPIPDQPIPFLDVANFSEGLAAVDSESGKWGYIDETGRMVIPGRYADAGPFSGGLAPVRLQPATISKTVRRMGKWTFIDRRGTSIGAYFDAAGVFSQGLAPVSPEYLWGYANAKGQLVIPAVYAAARPFFENFAATRLGGAAEGGNDHDGDYRGLWGFVDRTGKVVIRHQYVAVRRFSEGLAPACKLEECGAIDATGATRIPFIYSALSPFTDGIALARRPSGKKVFIDSSGRALGQASPSGDEYEDAKVFRNGVAAVKRGGLWGFIDRSGRMTVPPQFLDVTPDWPDEEDDWEESGWMTGEFAKFLRGN